MKKYVLLFTLFFTSACAFADDIAVVDLQQLVSHSNQVKQLKQEHSKKMAELDKIIINARGEISNESDQSKVLLLQDKYLKEFNTKKEGIEKEYNRKLADIEKNIKDEIAKKAVKDSYDYVFAKSVVLYGGKDITPELLNAVK